MHAITKKASLINKSYDFTQLIIIAYYVLHFMGLWYFLAVLVGFSICIIYSFIFVMIYY